MLETPDVPASLARQIHARGCFAHDRRMHATARRTEDRLEIGSHAALDEQSPCVAAFALIP